MPLAEGSTFAGYTIIRLLGAGAMGEVYLARHPRLPRDDALKVLTASTTDEYRMRFDREADLVAALWHPHIVGIHDRGSCDGRLWIAMDYVDGTDAGDLLRAAPGGLPADQVVRIVTAVAEALDYAHDRHLLHRDIKPSNILVTDGDPDQQRIMLADFGIARRDDEVSGLTGTDITVGTVSYAAPEQLRGEPLDGRADQYALAATAFELLTGRPPFNSSNQAVVISQHLTATPPRLGKLRPALAPMEPALSRALAKDPADRYPSCSDFARALGDQLGTEGGTRRGRRRFALPAVIGVLLIAAVAFAIGGFAGHRRAESHPADTVAPPQSPGTATAPATPAVIGARCAAAGATGTTADGSTAYCANLQYTDRYLWSLKPGDIPNPVVTTLPTAPVPYEDESPVLICMQQTGHSRASCTAEIGRANPP